MKREPRVQQRLRQTRTRLGLSQQHLADAAGVTRQSISSIESGQYTPTVAVAIRLAQALGCRVEDLFWTEESGATISAAAAWQGPLPQGTRVFVASVGDAFVAHPLHDRHAFRLEMVPADGTISAAGAGGNVRVNLVDSPLHVGKTVVLAGCTPALSLWARAAERWHGGLRVHWTFANSMAALAALADGAVHAAGVHLYDPKGDDFNTRYVAEALGAKAAILVNLGVWEEGLVVARGNPLRITGVADLAVAGVRIVNREPGAGARLLLDLALERAAIPPAAIDGYDRLVSGHLEVAQAVAAGQAHAGVSTAAVAATFGLGFVPLHAVRYDLAIPKAYLDHDPVQQLLGTLQHRRVRAQLQLLGGYDTTRTGDIVAATPAPA